MCPLVYLIICYCIPHHILVTFLTHPLPPLPPLPCPLPRTHTRPFSEYTTQFYPAVKAQLEIRGLVMPFELPEISNKPFPEPDDTWVDISEVHRRIDAQKKNHTTNSLLLEEGEGEGGKEVGGKTSEDDDKNKDKEDDKEGGIRWAAGFATLPAHANDLSEFFLASMIERVSDSWDLYVTTFLLQHDMLGLDSMNR